MKPHKCPCCDGTGKVSRPPWIAGDQYIWSGTSCGLYSCLTCNGTGIVWENKENEFPKGTNHFAEDTAGNRSYN